MSPFDVLSIATVSPDFGSVAMVDVLVGVSIATGSWSTFCRHAVSTVAIVITATIAVVFFMVRVFSFAVF